MQQSMMTGITYLIANSLKICDQSELIFLKHLKILAVSLSGPVGTSLKC